MKPYKALLLAALFPLFAGVTFGQDLAVAARCAKAQKEARRTGQPVLPCETPAVPVNTLSLPIPVPVPAVARSIAPVLTLVPAPLIGTEAKALPWPAQAEWREICTYTENFWSTGPSKEYKACHAALAGLVRRLREAKTAYVQSDLPLAFATVPAAFSARFLVVSDPALADIQIFVRAGVGGKQTPDMLAFLKSGEKAFEAVVPPRDEELFCQNFENANSQPDQCRKYYKIGWLSVKYAPPPPVSPWETLLYVVNYVEKAKKR